MIQLKVKSFGKIAEIVGDNVIISLENNTVGDLKNHLENTYIELEKFPFVIAIDRKIVSNDTVLNNDSEIALLPPFSGG